MELDCGMIIEWWDEWNYNGIKCVMNMIYNKLIN